MTAPGTATQNKMAVIGEKAKEFGKEAKVIGKKLGSEGKFVSSFTLKSWWKSL